MVEALSLDSLLSMVNGVGSSSANRFARLGIFSVRDLLETLPSRNEDRSQLCRIEDLRFEEERVIEVEVLRIGSRRSKRGVLIIQARVTDGVGKIEAIWFNQRYLLSQLKEGDHLLLYGQKKLIPSLGNPFLVKKIIPRLEIAPIYPATAGLGQGQIRLVLSKVKPLIRDLTNLIPQQFSKKYNFASRADVVEQAHFSHNLVELETARELFAQEELFLLALRVRMAIKERLNNTVIGLSIDEDLLKKMSNLFPFKLTGGQKKAAWEIILDLQKDQPMNRLLYGEVGSGKTAVGLLACGAVVSAEKQAIWLNPTVSLASQQYAVIKKIAEPLGLSVALRSSADKLGELDADIVVGTHALLGNSEDFKNVGLVIVDEQHRFGVEQRQKLLGKNNNIHLLMVTATPIPRSLAQTIFGHLKISYLTERPAMQKTVETVIAMETDRPEVTKRIRRLLEKNQQGYVICPLINPSETDALSLFTAQKKAVTKEYDQLKKLFPSHKVGLLHGKLKTAEKNKVMEDFKGGKIDILLSTTVVEVGIDNPKATWILIEHAEVFGLSQLHQLRGRVGRGADESVCFYLDSGLSENGTKRLQALKETTSGLELAEFDLSLRGPGEIVGLEQSGLPNLRYGSLSDVEKLKKAVEMADYIVEHGISHYPEIKRALDRENKNEPTLA